LTDSQNGNQTKLYGVLGDGFLYHNDGVDTGLDGNSSNKQVDGLPERYRVDLTIGSGGIAATYKAYDTEKDRVVAIKLLNPNISTHTSKLPRPHQHQTHQWCALNR
jgi:hypothetical protein